MSPVTIIDKYYPEDNERKHILLVVYIWMVILGKVFK